MSELQNETQGHPMTLKKDPSCEISWQQAPPEKDETQRAAETAAHAAWFGKLALPSLIYALLYVMFTYDNDFGIGILAWIVSTAVYVIYLFRAEEIKLKKSAFFYLGIMGLLGISTVLTTNIWLVLCNRLGFYLLLIYFLLVQTRDTDGWSIWEALRGICSALLGAIGKIPAPFTEGYSWLRSRDKDNGAHERRRMIIIGLLISIPAILILGSLLMNADAVFGNMLRRICFDWKLSTKAFHIIFTFLFGLFASYCGMHDILEKRSERVVRTYVQQPALIAQIFTTAILILYVWFCLIQVIYLFGGIGTLPKGMTYAQYARSGFFQLLFVCIINLILVLVVKQCFETSAYLNGVLLAICLCSYIMTASSAYRMILYIRAYRLTVLRIVVLVALAAIAILLAGVCRHIFSADFRILPYFIIVISTVYTLFSFINVDSYVARYNLTYLTEDNATETFQYLETLSLDAIPAVLHFLETADEHSYASHARKTLLERYPYPDDDRSLEENISDWFNRDASRDPFIRWLSGYRRVLTDNGPIAWNVSVYRAKCAVKNFFLPD